MATHAATRNLSGLARALAQHGLMPESEAESLQNQAQAANISFVEQILTSKRFTPNQVAVFGSRAFGVPQRLGPERGVEVKVGGVEKAHRRPSLPSAPAAIKGPRG